MIKEEIRSEEYMKARKEFINCLCMSIIGLGIPIIIALREWLPIMRAEKKKMSEKVA